MADTEFEELHRTFESLSINKNYKNTTPFYSLIPGIDDLEDSQTSKSDSSDQEDGKNYDDRVINNCMNSKELMLKDSSNRNGINNIMMSKQNINSHEVEDDEIGDGLKTINTKNELQLERTMSVQSITGERRRRKLPEIPKNKKCENLFLDKFKRGDKYISASLAFLCGQTTLADELRQPQQTSLYLNQRGSSARRSFLSLKCGYLLDEDSSPDSDRMQSLGDVDSGHSTAHSPNDLKSMSPQISSPQSHSPFPPPFGGVPFSQLEMLEATHRGLHKFMPRHHDEIEIEIGDPIYVQKEADDLWCEGVNLRTGRQGIFPSAYAVDLDYNDFDPSVNQVKKERYLLGYLGSVETISHKGTGVVCQAVRKIASEYGDSPSGQPCILEVSDQGLRMVDRSRPNGKKEKKPCIDYFYSLKNVSFCAFHPRDHRYIGFITKHPTVQRFACHVFKGTESTRPVAEAVGRAFQRFYQKFIETAYPIEDIYIE